MRFEQLSEQISINTISESVTDGVFEIDGLYAGYGVTIGNALRRVLLSSLPGGAITQVKINGISHEFSTLAGVTEDVVEIMLNLKRVRMRIFSDEPQVLTLKYKGEGIVTASDIKATAQVEIITPDAHIATLTEKSAELDMELTIERGLGYLPIEMRRSEKLPIGVIALDALFSPVTSVNFSVENMRVGERTDYNLLRLVIETDGSLTPSAALRKSSNILQDHFTKISAVTVKEAEPVEAESDKAKKQKSKKAK